MLKRILIHVALITGATLGAIGACRNDVPAPTLPSPIPEVTRGSPKPQPIDPEGKPRRAKPKRVSQVPPDAGGVGDVVDLPPVVDADIAIVRDAAQPLK